MTRWELSQILQVSNEASHDLKTGRDAIVYFGTGAQWHCQWEPLRSGATKVMGLVVWPIEHTKTGNYRLGTAVYVPASAIVALGFEPRRTVS